MLPPRAGPIRCGFAPASCAMNQSDGPTRSHGTNSDARMLTRRVPAAQRLSAHRRACHPETGRGPARGPSESLADSVAAAASDRRRATWCRLSVTSQPQCWVLPGPDAGPQSAAAAHRSRLSRYMAIFLPSESGLVRVTGTQYRPVAPRSSGRARDSESRPLRRCAGAKLKARRSRGQSPSLRVAVACYPDPARPPARPPAGRGWAVSCSLSAASAASPTTAGPATPAAAAGDRPRRPVA